MKLTYQAVVNNNLVNHARKMLTNGEELTYYIDKTYGWNKLYLYNNSQIESNLDMDHLSIFNLGHDQTTAIFIRDSLTRLDKLIDIDLAS